MSEKKIYEEALNKNYENKYPIKIVEMMSGISFFPLLKKDGTPKLNKSGEEIYKTSWVKNPNYNPLDFLNEGTYGYYFVEEETEEIVNLGETQNANLRPNNYNCVSFSKNYQPLGQKSNGSTNIGKNILMTAGLREGKNYKLMLVAFGECMNEFGERMIAPSQEKTMSKIYTEVTGKNKPLWNGKLKELVAQYKKIFEYGQR
jgi:hypothetical protein